MSFFKTVAIVLVAALANPFCCCYSADNFVEETKAEMSHGCCSSGQDMQQQERPDHAPDDCRHQADKESQITHVADSHDSLAKPVLFVAELLSDLQFETGDQEEVAKTRFARAQDARIPAPSVAQKYCVYLL